MPGCLSTHTFSAWFSGLHLLVSEANWKSLTCTAKHLVISMSQHLSHPFHFPVWKGIKCSFCLSLCTQYSEYSGYSLTSKYFKNEQWESVASWKITSKAHQFFAPDCGNSYLSSCLSLFLLMSFKSNLQTVSLLWRNTMSDVPLYPNVPMSVP